MNVCVLAQTDTHDLRVTNFACEMALLHFYFRRRAIKTYILFIYTTHQIEKPFCRCRAMQVFPLCDFLFHFASQDQQHSRRNESSDVVCGSERSNIIIGKKKQRKYLQNNEIICDYSERSRRERERVKCIIPN